MGSATPPLDAAQQWLLHAVTTPSASAEQAGAMLAGTDGLDAARRLEIYRVGYRRRLLSTMRHMHPALRELLGPDLFDVFAAGYLDAHPPRAYTLARLGERFAAYLEEQRPDRDLPAGEREPWADLMVDLVRYERLFAEVYDGPGTEEEPPAPWPTGLPDRVRGAPGVRLLRACAPVHEYHSAVRRGARPAPPAFVPSRIVVFRRNYRVVTASPPADAFTLLEALMGGAPPEQASVRAGLDPADARRQLRRWLAQRWITALPASPARESP
ncbi:HvfC/BufC N-terminal domain-containing protein [Actinomadura litoris]|uniref:HvfC/BufC N-terminal domain-containing protein n=1 Tax=Actinomadura litoris TaxID=2678616 RepID=UPI001FA6EE13|nr:DNA-binding domain-containing protein [Actinomadura litoris]